MNDEIRMKNAEGDPNHTRRARSLRLVIRISAIGHSFGDSGFGIISAFGVWSFLRVSPFQFFGFAPPLFRNLKTFDKNPPHSDTHRTTYCLVLATLHRRQDTLIFS
jgi:hypothetical protein